MERVKLRRPGFPPIGWRGARLPGNGPDHSRHSPDPFDDGLSSSNSSSTPSLSAGEWDKTPLPAHSPIFLSNLPLFRHWVQPCSVPPVVRQLIEFSWKEQLLNLDMRIVRGAFGLRQFVRDVHRPSLREESECCAPLSLALRRGRARCPEIRVVGQFECGRPLTG